jgi:hypothetical protein
VLIKVSNQGSDRPLAEIPFNRSSLLGRELEYIFQTISIGQIAGDQTYFLRIAPESILDAF